MEKHGRQKQLYIFIAVPLYKLMPTLDELFNFSNNKSLFRKVSKITFKEIKKEHSTNISN